MLDTYLEYEIMKKMALLMFVFALFATPVVNAQNKQLEKQLKKEYKLKMKEYSKGDWKVFGTSRTLEVALQIVKGNTQSAIYEGSFSEKGSHTLNREEAAKEAYKKIIPSLNNKIKQQINK